MTDRTCPSCHRPLPADASACPHCGVPGPTVISQTGADPTAPRMTVSRGQEEPVQVRLARALGGQYEVRRLLGSGGFADVFEIWDTQLERRLAVKVLRPEVGWTSGMLARFKQEARAIARLNHPNILPIHFVGEGEGLAFYVMPFVEGRSLGDLLRAQGALAPERAIAIARAVLEALEHAHQHGLVHRDIKPDNVMLEEPSGRVLLVDFGIARLIDAAPSHQTQAGFVVGTPTYMSPEQALGQAGLDHRTDLYALGAVLFQMVTGTPPFEGETSQEIVAKHLTEPVPVALERSPKVPAWLSDVIVRCLAKKPVDRFQSAAMVLHALERGGAAGSEAPVSARRVAARVRGAEPTAVRPAAPGRRGRSGRLAWPWVGLLVALVVALAAVRRQRVAVTIANRLVTPVRLTVAGRADRTLGADETVRIPVPRGASFTIQWAADPPRGAGGTPMGEALQGSLAANGLKKSTTFTIRSLAGLDAPYFAPLITNATNVPLEVTVNAGTATARKCGCIIPPGAIRAPIGYYRLYRNSAVEVTDPTGRSARFVDLGSRIDQNTGTVVLRFALKDLGRGK